MGEGGGEPPDFRPLGARSIGRASMPSRKPEGGVGKVLGTASHKQKKRSSRDSRQVREFCHPAGERSEQGPHAAPAAFAASARRISLTARHG